MPINFARVVTYLDAIANQPGVILDNSPHGAFWRLTRDQFVAGMVSGTSCHTNVAGASQNVPIPIVKKGDAANSPIFNILIGMLQLPMTDGTTCKKMQMPGGGPFITDMGASITLGDGTTVTGGQIQTDLQNWINAGCPENAEGEV
jgi:hypothetical protein